MNKRIEELALKLIAEGRPSPKATYRFQELLKRKGISFASGNGMTLDELCDFIEKTTPDVGSSNDGTELPPPDSDGGSKDKQP